MIQAGTRLFPSRSRWFVALDLALEPSCPPSIVLRNSLPIPGECKSIMTKYLKCIRSHRGTNDPECRNLSKSYLSCRMDQYVPAFPLSSPPPTCNLAHFAYTLFHGGPECHSRPKQGRNLVIRSCQGGFNQVLGPVSVSFGSGVSRGVRDEILHHPFLVSCQDLICADE